MTQTTSSPSPLKDTLFSRAAVIVAVIIVFVVGSYLLKNGPLEAGESAPHWKLSRVNGAQDEVSLDKFIGKVVVIDFWSTSCPPCLMQIPSLQFVQREFLDDVVVVGVAVGGESPAQLQQFAKNRSIEYIIAPDLRGVTATAYNVSRLPTLFIVGRDGKIVTSHEGFWESEQLFQTIRKEVSK